MNNVLKIFQYLRLYLFTILSNISPNRNIKSFIIIFFKSAFFNLKYSYRNIFKPANNIVFEFSKGNYWDRCINHLNFVGKYFNVNQIHKATVLELTVQSFTSKYDKSLNNDFFNNKNLINYSKYLFKLFNDTKYNKMLYWYGSFYHTFISNILSSNELEIITKYLANFEKIVVLIDDIRLFQGKFQNYPNKNTLVNWCKENDFLWEIEQDIFICKKI